MVITKLYEFIDWENDKIEWNNDNYIISLPSGELIYFDDDRDIDYLVYKNYIYYEETSKLFNYACSDFLAPKVKEYFEKKKTINVYSESQATNFLLNCGLLDGQFIINSDMSVDTYGVVNISRRDLKKIPIKFRKCTSDFNCSHNNLETLENAPKEVHGNFNCSYNNLTNLKGGPLKVFGGYSCDHNKLTSLTGCPITVPYFNCSFNLLRNVDDAPIVTKVFIRNNNLFKW
jgi:hypothetical protein